MLCTVQTANAQAHAGGNALLYSLPGVHRFASAKDAIVDSAIGTGGECGGTGICGFETITIDMTASPTSIDHTVMGDKKLLSFTKTVGTPWAVYQLKISDSPPVNGALGLQYQIASDNWHTMSVPGFFAHAGEAVRITVVHANTTVRIVSAAAAITNAFCLFVCVCVFCNCSADISQSESQC
jgi:hypothetical protein